MNDQIGQSEEQRSRVLRLGLTGDVMTGRGIDQIQHHPSDPALREPAVRTATTYIELAEQRSGPIPRPVDPAYIWGVGLAALRAAALDALIINLETAVTRLGRPWPDKAIHYRMHPANIDCLTVAGVDVAVLANNHVMDWSAPGLEESLDVVQAAGVRTAGAGREAAEAWAPTVVDVPSGGRLVVIAVGSTSSGIPVAWAAGADRPGVALLPEPHDAAVQRISDIVAATAGAGDVVVVSIHWGTNWGYDVPRGHRRLAHRLIDDAGVHLVHGHSSHHALGIEVHNGHLVLYGCGDLITDYEGIRGHQEYRGELGAIYLPVVDADTGVLVSLELVPTRMRRFQLTTLGPDDLQWLATVLSREGRRFGTGVELRDDGRLILEW